MGDEISFFCRNLRDLRVVGNFCCGVEGRNLGDLRRVLMSTELAVEFVLGILTEHFADIFGLNVGENALSFFLKKKIKK